MGSAVQVIVALLASAGAVGVLIAGLWALLIPGLGTGAALVLPVRGDGGGTEQTLKALALLRAWTGLRVPIILADGGLSPAGRAWVRTLMGGRTGVVLCPAEDLGALLASRPGEESEESKEG